MKHWITFILAGPTARNKAWRAIMVADYFTLRRLPGNRRRP